MPQSKKPRSLSSWSRTRANPASITLNKDSCSLLREEHPTDGRTYGIVLKSTVIPYFEDSSD